MGARGARGGARVEGEGGLRACDWGGRILQWGCLPISNGTPSSCVEKHGGPAMQRQKARIGSTEREHAHMHRMDVGDPCSHRGRTWLNINHKLYTYIELAASELPTWAQRARDRELTGRRRRQPPPRHSAACAAAGAVTVGAAWRLLKRWGKIHDAADSYARSLGCPRRP